MKGNKADEPYTKSDDYPDWGPVYLSAASKAMMLNWYRKAKKIRKEKRGNIRGKAGDKAARNDDRRNNDRVIRDVSDDEGEGEGAPLSWGKNGGLLNVSESTKAIAIKWNRSARARLQKKAGKGAGKGGYEDSQALVVANEASGQGRFRSGLKSRNLRK